MAAMIIPVDTFDCVVFGATGDLTLRKLLPALYFRFRDGQVTRESRIIAAARSELTDDSYRERAEAALRRHVKAGELDEDGLHAFLGMVHYAQVNGAKDEGWPNLTGLLEGHEERVRVFYLATSPELYGPTCENLASHGLVTPRSRVVLEKPIGHDLASARAINDQVGRVFAEAQIFRIDHYLGKETVQNLLALRFANTIFERLWNSDVIDHVQITVAETVGLETRGGLLRQVRRAARHGAEPPVAAAVHGGDGAAHGAGIRIRARREAEGAARAQARGAAPDQPRHRARPVRGRCGRGQGRGQLRPRPRRRRRAGAHQRHRDLRGAEGEINTFRWAKVPFYLRTGKRLPTKVSEIVVQFRDIPFTLFPPDAAELTPNRLIIRLQPEEGMKLGMMTKDPGPGGLRLRPAELAIGFEQAFSTRFPDAYERLLMDTVRGNTSLFMRRDEVEAAWGWVEPIIEAWQESPERPRPYASGSWGPTASIALIERDGRTWHEELA